MYDAPVGVLAVKIARGEDGAVGGGDTVEEFGRDIGLFVSLRRHLVAVSTYTSLIAKRGTSRLTAVKHVVARVHDLLLTEGTVLQETRRHLECVQAFDGLVDTQR